MSQQQEDHQSPAEDAPDQLMHAHDMMSEGTRGPESLMDRLRARHEEAGEQLTCDIDLPYYEGEMFARYHLIDGKRLKMITDKAQRTEKNDAERALSAAMDTIIQSCVEIFVRDNDEVDEEGKATETPLSEKMKIDEPVRYDHNLAAFFNLETDGTARSVLWRVFGRNSVAITNHNLRLSRWMSDPSRDPAGGLLGEIL
jgi:hypothetical protein